VINEIKLKAPVINHLYEILFALLSTIYYKIYDRRSKTETHQTNSDCYL